MKFELDHRTGHMMPKQDDNIYFAKSMGGGLIVDDKKNRKNRRGFRKVPSGRERLAENGSGSHEL